MAPRPSRIEAKATKQASNNCTATGFALSRVEQQREKREERREKRSQKRPPEIPKLTDSRVFLAPGPPRIASFLQCKTPRGLIIPCKNAGILFRESSAEERSDDGAEKREKREERREKMATSSIPCISTVSRGHLKEVMKIRWGHRNSRKLESLHFYGVP